MFEEWKQSMELRPGNFIINAKRRMFFSHQTYQGIQITVFSTIEATKYLLQHGCCNMYSRVSNNRPPQAPLPGLLTFPFFPPRTFLFQTPPL